MPQQKECKVARVKMHNYALTCNHFLSRLGGIFFLMLMILPNLKAATYYFTSTTGLAALNSTANWTLNANGTGANPPNFTTNGDVFNVVANASGIVAANWTLGAGAGGGRAVTLNIAGSVTVNAGRTITLSGKNANSSVISVTGTIVFQSTAIVNLSINNAACMFDLQGGATLRTANAIGIFGTNCSIRVAGASCTVNLSAAANYEMNGANQTMVGLPVTVNDFTLSGSGTKTWSSLTTINGNFSLQGTSISATVDNLTINGDLNIDNGTSYTVNGFDFVVVGTTHIGSGSSGSIAFASNAGNKIFGGLVTIANGALWDNTGNASFTFQGGITSVPLYDGGNGLHQFTTNNQQLTGNFIIASIDVTGIQLQNNNVLQITSTLSGTGSLVQSVAATLALGGDCTINNINATADPNTVDFNGSGDQTIPGFTYHQLIFSNSGTKFIPAGTIVSCKTVNVEDNALVTIDADGGGRLNVVSGS